MIGGSTSGSAQFLALSLIGCAMHSMRHVEIRTKSSDAALCETRRCVDTLSRMRYTGSYPLCVPTLIVLFVSFSFLFSLPLSLSLYLSAFAHCAPLSRTVCEREIRGCMHAYIDRYMYIFVCICVYVNVYIL